MIWVVRHRRPANVPSLRRAFSFVLIALAAAFGAGPAVAQSYQPGQPIEYKAESWPERWAKGVFVRDIPGGTQVLIRQEPTQFFPEGFQRAYERADVRPVAAAGAGTRGAAAQPVRPRAPAPPPWPASGGGSIAGTCRGGPMSQQQVLGFLRERLGSGDPFANNPLREAALQALREEILCRGVDFHKQAIGDFSNQIMRYGALSNVTSPLRNNFGPPAAQSELYGNWRLIKVGATTSVSRGSRLYQRQEYAGLAGSMNISANGTYVWNSPSGVLRGSWRPATRAEMSASDKGGAGVVLLRSKSGADWLVFRRTEEGPEGTGILVTDLATRNLRERGTR